MVSSIPVEMFGLSMEPTKTYSQTVEQNTRLTMACLSEVPADGSRTLVRLTVNDKTFTLCALTPSSNENQTLDVNLFEGDEIMFATVGNCSVDLTGNHYVVDFEDDEDMDDEELDSDMESIESCDSCDLPVEQLIEMKQGQEGSEDSEDMMSGSEDMGSELGSEFDSEDETEFLDADGNVILMDDSDVESLDEETIQMLLSGKRALPIEKETKNKKAKLVEIVEQVEPKVEAKVEKKTKPVEKKAESKVEKKTDAKVEKKTEAKVEKKTEAKVEKKTEPKVEKKEKPVEKKAEPQVEKTEGLFKKTLPSGLEIEDIKAGSGPKAKNGKKVRVRYIGKLSNGKVFDSNTKGEPFSFTLGKGEVIKGWDMGIQGMSVGSTRKITIPASLGYGKKGAAPTIPPNATLEFEVKLLEIK